MSDEQTNPKLEGSNIIDCRPQVGECPTGCNQCFYNRPGAFYCDINEPQIPDPDKVAEERKIVRMNSGHDSNIEGAKVLDAWAQYEKVFFNTSIPRFDFPGPVVFTANAREEEPAWCPLVDRKHQTRKLSTEQEQYLDRIMFVRLRVSPSNLQLIQHAVACWTARDIPVVLTFMAYYDGLPPCCEEAKDGSPAGTFCNWTDPDNRSIRIPRAYSWKVRHINSYYCPSRIYMSYVLNRMRSGYGGRLVTMCGTLDSNLCRDCRNCETYYIQAERRLQEQEEQDG